MRTLTAKQDKVADLVLNGRDKIQAILDTYDCKKSTAYTISCKLNKNKLFQEKLNNHRKIANNALKQEAGRFLDVLEERLPKSEVIGKLVELINSDDKRVIMQAIQEYNKVMGNYADKKLGIYRDLKQEQSNLYLTEAEVYEDNQRQEAPESD